jgi:hypothetical protein
MNDNEKWFEALRQWRIGGGVNRVVSLEDVDQLIAYVEELKKSQGSFIHGYAKGIKMNPLEDDWIALEEENKKFKAKVDQLHADYYAPSVTIDELREENNILKEKLAMSDSWTAILNMKEANEKLKAELDGYKYGHGDDGV